MLNLRHICTLDIIVVATKTTTVSNFLHQQNMQCELRCELRIHALKYGKQNHFDMAFTHFSQRI